MSSVCNRPASLLDNLAEDKNLKFKHSESAEYLQVNTIAEIDRLYDYLMSKMKQVRVHLQQGDSSLYQTQSQYGKIAYIRMVLDYFIDKLIYKNPFLQDNTEIVCEQCRNYEQNLQKLQGDIRQHIRLEQQLKLYQQSLQEKIQQMKKQNEKNIQKLSKLKTNTEEFKSKQNSWLQKISKLQEQNQRIKQQTIKNKSGHLAGMGDHSARMVRDNSQSKSIKVLHDLKQNMQVPRNSQKKDEKRQPRKSCQKRPQSSDKWKQQQQQANTNSNKHFPLAQKLIMQKNKQQKRKAIQAKFQMRR